MMTMNRKSALTSVLRIAIGCGMMLLAASALEAQQQNPGTRNPPKVKPPWGHDRSGFPPRSVPPPQANPQASLSPHEGVPVHTGTPSATADVVTTLYAGTLISPGGIAISLPVQHALLDLLIGAEDMQAPLAVRLAPEENLAARKEALVLVHRLHGLVNAPSGLRDAVIAFNALVDASSAEFLSAPPAEFLAIHAALEMLVRTVSATNSRRDKD